MSTGAAHISRKLLSNYYYTITFIAFKLFLPESSSLSLIVLFFYYPTRRSILLSLITPFDLERSSWGSIDFWLINCSTFKLILLLNRLPVSPLDVVSLIKSLQDINSWKLLLLLQTNISVHITANRKTTRKGFCQHENIDRTVRKVSIDQKQTLIYIIGTYGMVFFVIVRHVSITGE